MLCKADRIIECLLRVLGAFSELELFCAMGKAAQKKTPLAAVKDFAKHKKKVGKHPGRDNVTRVAFKSRAIHVAMPAAAAAEQPHTHRGQTLPVRAVAIYHVHVIYKYINMRLCAWRRRILACIDKHARAS